jgi:hypothetical protein
MKCKNFFIIACSVFCMLMTGCALKRPQPNAEVKFEVPSKLSIVKQGSLVRIIPTNNSKHETPGFAAELARKLNQAGYLKVGNGKNPKYILSLDTFWADRCDNKRDINYNVRYYAKTKVYKDGSSHEYITHDYGASYTSSLIGAVAIYEVNNIEPLAYFNVAAEDTKWIRNQNKYQTRVACDTKIQRNKLMAEIVVNINSLLSKERRDVPVILPSGGDSEAKQLLRSNRIKPAEKRLKPLLPPAKLSELSTGLYDQWNEEAKQNEKPERSMPEDLANYYLFYMAKEAGGITEDSARIIHNAYTSIILLADDKSLINAAADSMSRLEETANRLGIRL